MNNDKKNEDDNPLFSHNFIPEWIGYDKTTEIKIEIIEELKYDNKYYW